LLYLNRTTSLSDTGRSAEKRVASGLRLGGERTVVIKIEKYFRRIDIIEALKILGTLNVSLAELIE
jgi:hypothetical protein